MPHAPGETPQAAAPKLSGRSKKVSVAVCKATFRFSGVIYRPRGKIASSAFRRTDPTYPTGSKGIGASVGRLRMRQHHFIFHLSSFIIRQSNLHLPPMTLYYV